MPHYYIENRIGPEDAHEDLTPNMSALIILSHIKEGVELAQEHKIGTKITEIIKQHHGTSLVSYFYSKAKETGGPRSPCYRREGFPLRRTETADEGGGYYYACRCC